MSKKKHPALLLLFTILSGGIFGELWVYLIAKDINTIEGTERIKIKQNAIITVILNVLFLITFIMGWFSIRETMQTIQNGGTPEAPNFLLFAPMIFIFAILAHFNRLVKQIEGILKERIEVPSQKFFGNTTMIFLVSLPILQSKLNQVITSRDSQHLGCA